MGHVLLAMHTNFYIYSIDRYNTELLESFSESQDEPRERSLIKRLLDLTYIKAPCTRQDVINSDHVSCSKSIIKPDVPHE